MFTQACFIKNYKRDLISKIENIGYRNYGNPFQFTDFSILYTTIDGYYVPYRVQVDSSWIDCGTNEELFLAIAALRDDSDKFQYFTNGVFWIKCSQLELKHELDNNYEEFCVADFHKATVQELIEHFKP